MINDSGMAESAVRRNYFKEKLIIKMLKRFPFVSITVHSCVTKEVNIKIKLLLRFKAAISLIGNP